MKLAMLAPECSPSWGGVGSYTFNLICNLPSDVDTHIITIDRKTKDPFEDYLLDKNVTIHKIMSISEKDSFFYNAKFQLKMLKELSGLNKRFNFDIIHSHSGHLPHYFTQFQHISPMVVTVHTESKGLIKSRNLTSYRKDSTEHLNDLLSPIIEFGEWITFRRADRLLPISKFTLNQINELYNVDTEGRSCVIYNGVDINHFRPLKRELDNKITICFVGRLYAIKGLDILLESIIGLIKDGYKINLIIAGRGNTDYLKNYLKKVPSDSYSILGTVKYQDMPNVYNLSDILILPSLYEGCSGAILEAMSCGKTVIASDVGGTPEIIEDGKNGFLFESRNTQQLKSKIVDIIEETTDLKNIGKQARKTVEKRFSWADRGIEVHNQYKALLDNK